MINAWDLETVLIQAVKCGDFSGNIFCTAGEDKKVVLTYDTGEHLATVAVENAPLQALFSPTAAGNTAMSAVQLSVSDGKSLLVSSVRALRDAAGSKATVKLEFDGCGDIISHAWCGSLVNTTCIGACLRDFLLTSA